MAKSSSKSLVIGANVPFWPLVCALLLGWHYVLAQRYCSESAAVSIKASCIPREERRYVAPVLPRLRLPPRYGRFEVFIEMSSFRSSAVTRNFYPLQDRKSVV